MFKNEKYHPTTLKAKNGQVQINKSWKFHAA